MTGPSTARRGIITLMRGLVMATHAGPTAVVTLVMAVLSRSVGLPWQQVLLIALAVLTGQASVGWSNDAVDAARDVANARSAKPVVAGLLTARTLWWCAGVAAGCSVVLSYAAAGVVGGSAHVLAVASAWTYNLSLKATVLSPVPYAVSFGLLPLMLAGAAGRPEDVSGWAVAVFAVLAVGAHLANGIPDIDADVRVRHRGLVARVGRRAAAAGAVGALLAGTATLLLGLGIPAWSVVVLLGLQGSVLLMAARQSGGRRLFDVVLGLMVLDLLLVVATGSRLIIT